LPPIAGPAEKLRRRQHDLARPSIFEVPQAELDRIRARASRELVHEALDRKNIHVSAEGAQR
jgi:hypothetical protein